MDVTEPPLWRHGDFMKIWTGQTVSELGSVVTRTAIPIAAVITLHANAQVGILVESASTAGRSWSDCLPVPSSTARLVARS